MAALKGTFFAFRRRARGGVILRATLAHAILLIAIVVTAAVLYGQSVGPGGSVSLTDEEDVASRILLASPFLIIGGLFLYAVIMASYEAALLRWMIRGETAGFAGFSLGGDMWRVYAGYWIWFFAGIGVWIATFLISVLGLAAAGFARNAAADWWVGYLALGIWVLLVTPLALRMSSGNAASIARQRLVYFESWRVSSGRALALFGSFAIHWAIWFVLWVALYIGAAFIGYMAYGGETEPPAEVMNIILGIGFGVSLLVANMAMSLLSAGANARAVLVAIEEGKLQGMTPDLANVFD